MKAYKEVKCCRICGNERLVPVLNLGDQVLSGIFPESNQQAIPIPPQPPVITADFPLNDSFMII